MTADARTAADAKAAGTPARPPARRRRPVEAEPDDTEVVAAPVDAFQRLRRGGPALPGGGESEAEDEHAWMTTYTDMVTLLLTCFIMLISLATFTDRAPAPVQPAVPSATPRPDPDAEAPAPPVRLPDALFLRQPPETWSARLSRDLERFAGRAGTPGGVVAGGMTVEHGAAAVTVRLNDRLLFPSGRVEVAAEGLALLHALAPVLAAAPARIEVQGHTDSVPIASWLFPSNWELSGARAAAVVRALVDGGVPAVRLSAAGYADTVPRADNATPEGRQDNRRVELVLRTRFDPPEAQPIPAPEAQPIPAPAAAGSDRMAP